MNQVEKAPGKNFNLWIVAIVGIFVGILLMVGGTKTMGYTDSAEFCSSCHIMEAVVESAAGSSHAQLACNDCHLPQDNKVVKIVDKARVGMGHIYYNTIASDSIPDVLHATDWTINIINDNCISCHEDIAANDKTLAAAAHDVKENCTDCHRSTPHGVQSFKKSSFFGTTGNN